MKKILINIFLIAILTKSCISIAKIKDFPDSSKKIDFEKYSNENIENEGKGWTYKSKSEYFIDKDITISENDLIEKITTSLKKHNYLIYLNNKHENLIIGKRGLRANEWNSRVAVYYRINEKSRNIKILIKNKITQDIFGGWEENRAKIIGESILFE